MLHATFASGRSQRWPAEVAMPTAPTVMRTQPVACVDQIIPTPATTAPANIPKYAPRHSVLPTIHMTVSGFQAVYQASAKRRSRLVGRRGVCYIIPHRSRVPANTHPPRAETREPTQDHHDDAPHTSEPSRHRQPYGLHKPLSRWSASDGPRMVQAPHRSSRGAWRRAPDGQRTSADEAAPQATGFASSVVGRLRSRCRFLHCRVSGPVRRLKRLVRTPMAIRPQLVVAAIHQPARSLSSASRA